ncbi:unnamed protein product [Rotaria magnacalcarata]|uniref:carbonic anhydrase n=2 Tax=Rotaria magnacalcarata TaxID=392030 RepID=A0A816EQL3_9BILA|nr:unnamed protein product [Rotaria magnacalcarata]
MLHLFILILILNNTIASADWDYAKNGPDVWKENYPTCAGENQSPINIRTRCTVFQPFSRFEFTSIYYEPIKFNLTNNGHTIKAVPNNPTSISLTGGNLKGTYLFESFHLHWGPNHNSGSEHQVNGDKSAGEIHFVYIHPESKQRAVLSFLMETEANKSQPVYLRNRSRNVAMEKQWQNYFDAAHKLIEQNSSTTLDLTLELLMGSNVAEFWRYLGSLTTPSCAENVIWTVFRQPISILDYDFGFFRDDLFFESYRGPQPLYHRQVNRSFLNEKLSPIPDENLCVNKISEAGLFFDIFHQTTICVLHFSFLTFYRLFYLN